MAVITLLLVACGDDTAEVAGQPESTSSTTTTSPSGRPPRYHNPVGEWELVLSGETLGVKWQLLQTPSNQGGICTSLQLDPPALLADSDLPPDHLYKGKSFGCGGDLPTHRPIEFAAANQEPRSPYFFVSPRTDESVKQVALLFSDGSEELAHPVKGASVVLYPTTKTLERLRLTMTDESFLDCKVTWPAMQFARPNCLAPLPPPPPGG